MYADGVHISYRRREKAALLEEAIRRHCPPGQILRACDFGCADGAIPRLLLESAEGRRIREYVGLTLLRYNPRAEKDFHQHPRLTIRIGDLEHPVEEFWPEVELGAFDLVTATGFFPYLSRPEAALANAAKLLRPGGWLLTMIPAPWLLRLRQSQWLPSPFRNTHLRSRLTPADFVSLAEAAGFETLEVRRVQWSGLGLALVRWIEATLDRAGAIQRIGTNCLFVHRKLKP